MQADGTLYFEPANKGLKAYDALGYDKVPASPTLRVPVGYNKPAKPAKVIRKYTVSMAEAMACIATVPATSKHVHNTEGLINTTIKDLHSLVKVKASRVYGGFSYTNDSAKYKREYLEANSLDNILLPTGANDLCFKCGLTVSCRCTKTSNDMPYAEFVAWQRTVNSAWQAANLIPEWCG